MLMLLIGIILFVVNFTAGAVGLIALAMHGSYFLAYAITWGVEIAIVVLFYLIAFVGATVALVRN